MKRLLFIQPIIASYRKQALSHLAKNFELTLAYDTSENGGGFSSIKVENSNTVSAPIKRFLSGRISYQKNILFTASPGDSVVIFADPRFLSYWALLIVSRLRRVKVFSHGQGSFAYPQPSMARRLMYRAMTLLSHRYICYNDYVRSGMLEIGCPEKKLRSAENSIQFETVVTPNSRSFNAPGILFIGRLRPGCGLDKLIDSVEELKEEGISINVEVVGSGTLLDHYIALYGSSPNVKFHGSIYRDSEVAEISMSCRAGCYPGDAGLSVVHFFALSLPAIVHGSTSLHMGPEPSYVKDGYNGFKFSRESDSKDLKDKLRNIWRKTPREMSDIGRHAFSTYLELNSPSLGERFERILLE
ncbi:glycosyltransferase [Stenotrophomonas maltophilia]|uniref:glycosyltransferase n=1 Tax=Stenotrophomonas maltophilia TaxID=40324 RepID=UPI0013DD1FB6|nr:glycosyltransferase [Stenotrophomonas maltophilia]